MIFATRKKIALGLMSFGMIAAGLLAALPVAAVGWYTVVPECARPQSVPGATIPDAPSLNCALMTFGNIGMIVLGLTGSAALFMFVYGGFTYMYGGLIEKSASVSVQKGKTILTNAIAGLFIIMTAGVIIQYAMEQVGVKKEWAIGQTCGEYDEKKGGPAGQMIQKPDGKLACVTSCGDLDKPFDCVTDTNTKVYDYCVAGLCPSNANQMCCR